MNFLGHLYLSNNDKKLMLHNLFGDFVKGRDLSFYPEEVQQGIILHRKIDDFIDHHPKVLELVHALAPELPKVAAVAVDLFFDHLLAKNWLSYHKTELNLYLKEFYESIDTSGTYFSAEFSLVMQRMVQYNWISHYPSHEGLHKACNGVSRRISFPTELINGLQVFLKHEKLISQTFEPYMADAILKFKVDY